MYRSGVTWRKLRSGVDPDLAIPHRHRGPPCRVVGELQPGDVTRFGPILASLCPGAPCRISAAMIGHRLPGSLVVRVRGSSPARSAARTPWWQRRPAFVRGRTEIIGGRSGRCGVVRRFSGPPSVGVRARNTSTAINAPSDRRPASKALIYSGDGSPCGSSMPRPAPRRMRGRCGLPPPRRILRVSRTREARITEALPQATLRRVQPGSGRRSRRECPAPGRQERPRRPSCHRRPGRRVHADRRAPCRGHNRRRAGPPPATRYC